jgi:hypothetical protein
VVLAESTVVVVSPSPPQEATIRPMTIKPITDLKRTGLRRFLIVSLSVG